jgi:hypothetical protein
MHTYEEYHQILELWEQGRKKKRIAIITRINRTTVRECIERYETVAGLEAFRLKHPDVPRNLQILKARNDQGYEQLFRAYVYLLGIYLGDGYIVRLRKTFKLRISCDSNYPNLIESFAATIRIVTPQNKVGKVKQPGNCIELFCYNNFWPDLFPQHGIGSKHLRPIRLEDWQQHAVNVYPHEFIKGLLQTDGCRTNNIVYGTNYPRYEFCNYSADIRNLFSETCTLLGVHWKPSSMGRNIQIARRRDVEFLDQFIGPKS